LKHELLCLSNNLKFRIGEFLLVTDNEFEIRFSKKIQNGQFNMADIYFKKSFSFYEKYLDVSSLIISLKSDFQEKMTDQI